MVRFAFGDRGHETPVDARQVGAEFGSIRVDTTDQIVLLVGHNPRTRAAPAIPGGGVAVVSGFHGAVVVVAAVDLGVAVVEAAAGVVVVAVNDPVLPLCLVVDRGALRVVLAEAHARRDEDAVGLVAHDRNRRHVGDREVVKPTHGRAAESAAGHLDEVVVLRGLVVDGGDPAVRVGAERVLRGRVGVSARIRDRRGDGLNDADVHGLAVRLAQDLVERAVVGGVQRARGAVGGHAGVAGGGVDVTWALRPGRRNIGSRPGLLRHRQRGANQRERQCEHIYKIDSRLHVYPICLAGLSGIWSSHGSVDGTQVNQSGKAMSKSSADALIAIAEHEVPGGTGGVRAKE